MVECLLNFVCRYRPPRTSHCRLCDVCTEQTDHHCSYLNNCIGRRNYSSFIAFLVSSAISGSVILGASIAHLVIRAKHTSGHVFWREWRTLGTLIVLVITAVSLGPIVGLLGYHCRLIWLGRTTIEMVSSNRFLTFRFLVAGLHR